MNRVVGFWVILLLLAFAVSLFVSCRDDVLVPFPPSLQGNYKGIYTYEKIDETNQIDSTYEQLIRWRFTSVEYQMRKDSSIAESLRVFCDVDGDYEIGTGVEMTLTDGNVKRSVCTEDWGPDGAFSLVSGEDTVRLQQIITDQQSGLVQKRLIRLVLIQ